MDICVDTSTIMAVLLGEASRGRLLKLTEDADLQSAPTLPWEVGNALTALFRRRRLSRVEGQAALRSFRRIPLRLAEVDIEAAVEMADDHDIYAYDAYVLECARRYRAPLLSLDLRQCAVAREIGVIVMEV